MTQDSISGEFMITGVQVSPARQELGEVSPAHAKLSFYKILDGMIKDRTTVVRRDKDLRDMFRIAYPNAQDFVDERLAPLVEQISKLGGKVTGLPDGQKIQKVVDNTSAGRQHTTLFEALFPILDAEREMNSHIQRIEASIAAPTGQSPA